MSDPQETISSEGAALLVSADCLHKQFEARASQRPDAVAMEFGKRRQSFGQLNERANRIARELVLHCGARSGQVIGLALEDAFEAPELALAALKTGAAYLPIDTRLGGEAMAFMLKAAGAVALLDGRRDSAETFYFDGQTIDPKEALAAQTDGSDLGRPVGGDDAAYVLVSTDASDPLRVTHAQALSRFEALDAGAGAEAESPNEWIFVTDSEYGIPVFDQLWALSRGRRVVAMREDDLLPAPATRNRFTDGQATPLLSLFYWGSEGDDEDRYRLLVEGCKFADDAGLHAVWTPERHFHAFGGNFPNPSVTSAAIAAMTKNIKIRAGSVVLPLQEPIRVAEEWAVVDNLSQGRVGIAFASGWAANDFALAPENHQDRKEVMMRGIDEFETLWSGGSVTRREPSGDSIQLQVFPRPIQTDGMPIWLTAAGNPDTFKLAGERGFGVLTLLQGQDLETLAAKIAVYREAWASNPNNEGRGHVTLMLHTFLAEDTETARAAVKQPLCNYLKSYIGLAKSLQPKDSAAAKAFEMDPSMEQTILERAFNRYFESCGLLGSVPEALKMMERLEIEDIDEVGCLIDFGLPTAQVFEGFKYLRQLKVANDARLARSQEERSLAGQLARRHGAGLQCQAAFIDKLSDTESGLAALRGASTLLCESLSPSAREALQAARIATFDLSDGSASAAGEGLARSFAPPSAAAPQTRPEPAARRLASARERPARRNVLRRN